MTSKVLNNLPPYSVYSGCGNDFIMIDDREHAFPWEDRALIAQMCDRKTGIGADGVILLYRSKVADFRMRIFNSDGSEAEMCGNGIRCLGEFLIELEFPRKPYKIETFDRILDLSFTPDGNISVNMGALSECQWHISMNEKEIEGDVHFLNTGVPHLCVFVPDVDTVNIRETGKMLRNHPLFQPKGTNVNFIECQSNGKIRIRTYERGVEGETLACGTGATASALACAKIKGLRPPLTVTLKSNETLTIHFDEHLENISMTGSVKKILA